VAPAGSQFLSYHCQSCAPTFTYRRTSATRQPFSRHAPAIRFARNLDRRRRLTCGALRPNRASCTSRCSRVKDFTPECWSSAQTTRFLRCSRAHGIPRFQFRARVLKILSWRCKWRLGFVGVLDDFGFGERATLHTSSIHLQAKPHIRFSFGSWLTPALCCPSMSCFVAFVPYLLSVPFRALSGFICVSPCLLPGCAHELQSKVTEL
jgi:hypothetical protein